jgi:hypothetical protein
VLTIAQKWPPKINVRRHCYDASHQHDISAVPGLLSTVAQGLPGFRVGFALVPSWHPLFANGGGDFYLLELNPSGEIPVRHFRIDEAEASDRVRLTSCSPHNGGCSVRTRSHIRRLRRLPRDGRPRPRRTRRRTQPRDRLVARIRCVPPRSKKAQRGTLPLGLRTTPAPRR